MDPSTESLWSEFRVRLRAFVRSRISDEQAVDDVLQHAFLRMHQSLRAGHAPDQPQAWVFAITRNAIANHYRAEKAHGNRVAAKAVASKAADAPAALSSETEVDAMADLARCVEPLLRGLAPPYREAIRLTALEGMTQDSAAKKVGVSLSGMKSRVQRGRSKLRDLFEACCAIEVDARGRPIEAEPAAACPCQADGT